MDCSILPTRFPGVFHVTTTDFFFPLVDDPYVQGQIACANVLSDLYAVGVVDCDSMLMLLGVCADMTEAERDAVTPLIIRGFNDHARLAGTIVTGGQTVKNPWPLIGGVASALCRESDFIRPEGAQVGDVLVLTKALGTNIAINLLQWKDEADKWARVASVIDADTVDRAFDMACASMVRLNRTAARLMHVHKAHAATDVTGFGILGHAANLARHQSAPVSFELHSLPVWRGLIEADKVWAPFKLMKGVSPETSGGLLVCMPEAAAKAFCQDILREDGQPAWIVGRVVEGDRSARFASSVTVIDV